MSRRPPTLSELTSELSQLGDRVGRGRGRGLSAEASSTLRWLRHELVRFIPGLEPPPDAATARIFARSATAALENQRPRLALARALKGLACAPHDPQLFYLAATACFELGAAEDAVRLLGHVLWIHPGYTEAHRDLESLSAWLQSDASSSAPDPGTPLAFDAIDESPDKPRRARRREPPPEEGGAEEERAA